jgi:hypothetical protein
VAAPDALRAREVVRDVDHRDRVAVGEPAVVDGFRGVEVPVAEDGEGDRPALAHELDLGALDRGAHDLGFPREVEDLLRRSPAAVLDVRAVRLAGRERDEPHAPAALLGGVALLRLRDVVPQRDLEEGAEASARGIGLREEAALDRPREEALREVERFVGAPAERGAQVGADRLPVEAGQALEGRGSVARAEARPVRARERGRERGIGRVAGHANSGREPDQDPGRPGTGV